MKKYLKYSLPVLLSASLLASCSKQIEEAYLNPNADTKKPIEELLPGLIDNMTNSYSAAGSNYGTTNDGLYLGKYIQFWAQSVAGNQYDRMGGATGGSDLLGSVWAMHYYGQGQNLNRIIEWGSEEQKWDYVGVAHAIRSWGWLTLTNVYGEAILKQAFNTSQRVFDYDSQEEIYAEVRRVAHVALSFLNRTDGNVSQQNLAKGDKLMFNGDVNKWKKFVYSVLARSFNHLTNKANYNADSVIYYANLGIIDHADNAYAQFTAAGPIGTFHFWGPQRGNFGAQRQTRFIADLMNGINPTFTGVSDPRAWYILRENPNGTFTGIRPAKGMESLALNDRPNNYWGGLYATTTSPDANDVRYVYGNNPKFPIISAAEVHFMKAEAYYRKGLKAEARNSYIDGIRSSFEMLKDDYNTAIPAGREITDQTILDFLANSTIVPAQADLRLSHIMLQKYIAMYGYGVIETWVDMRRYHYTDEEPGTGQQVYAGFEPLDINDRFANNLGKLAYRCRPRYNSEYLYNVEALQKVGGLDLDYHTKEMWFSQP